MSARVTAARPPIAAPHLRRDAWWALPVTTAIVLGSFILYSPWAAFQNAYYWAPPYLSPFYSPCLSAKCLHVTFGWGLPEISLPIIGVLSPAFLILWGPGLFRLTCYYYRKAYYRSFWLSPPACALPDAQKRRYTGETRFPLVLQNYHRYLWYVAVIFIVLLTWDAILAFRFPDPGGGTQFGIGVGTLVLTANAILLAGYTFGCHSMRHLVGGRLDCISQRPLCHKLYKGCSALNARHMLWAWTSLVAVGFSDLYVRLCSMGVWSDLRIF